METASTLVNLTALSNNKVRGAGNMPEDAVMCCRRLGLSDDDGRPRPPDGSKGDAAVRVGSLYIRGIPLCGDLIVRFTENELMALRVLKSINYPP